MEKLMNYHVVVVTERMRDRHYISGLARMFGVHPRRFETNLPGFCTPESTYWNKVYPPVIRNETVEKLEKINQIILRIEFEE